jgi:hypothetical protein
VNLSLGGSRGNSAGKLIRARRNAPSLVIMMPTKKKKSDKSMSVRTAREKIKAKIITD